VSDREGDAAGAAAGESSAPLPGSHLLDLVRVMDTLRRSCPWDARQTHESLMPYLLEETYEAEDALAAGDPAAVREELGDVLLQVVFHARIAQERTDGTGYDIDDVADAIIRKLTRRHPHVFGDVAVSGADEVSRNWDAIKAAERAERAAASGGAGSGGAGSGEGRPAEHDSALAGVPMGQPALALAAQLLRRAQRAGAPDGLPDDLDGVSDVGRRLFALAAEAQDTGLDPELELRAAARAYADGVRRWEAGNWEARNQEARNQEARNQEVQQQRRGDEG
jgi:XTP/dITP diphosphohydrolase